MAAQDILYDAFKKNAELADARVARIGSFSEAIDCVAKLVKNHSGRSAIIAAPELSDSELNELQHKTPDIKIMRKDLHHYSEGISMAITNAEFGIADTGTLVINSKDMDKRLATMIADVHVAFLPESKIAGTAADLIPDLDLVLSASAGYLAFVTGPSRTADIERVLVVGVHGPLELHILVVKDN
jgi:L-lactate dehydrogenase complex protein LldG